MPKSNTPNPSKRNKQELNRLKRIGNAAIRSIQAGLRQKGTHGLFTIMSELGFTNKSQSGWASIHKKDGYAFKIPYLVGRKTPHLAIPTWSKNTKRLGLVFIQPLADTSAEAYKKFMEATQWAAKRNSQELYTREEEYITRKGMKHLGRDCHNENCGMYKGQPVVFDW